MALFSVLLVCLWWHTAVGDCVHWQQTDGCNPHGRKVGAAVSCSIVVQGTVSGYCDCGDGHKIFIECNHGRFRCEEECQSSFVTEPAPVSQPEPAPVSQPEPDLCQYWQTTDGCTPDGETRGKEHCETVVQRGTSGYCVCEGDKRVAEVGCVHAAFTCKEECKATQQDSQCAWHAARGCNPNQSSQHTQACGDYIAGDQPGYCQCQGWRSTARLDCDHLPTRCENECTLLRVPDYVKAEDKQLVKQLRGTTWRIQRKRLDIKLLPDHTFEAPHCKDPSICMWNVVGRELIIQWGRLRGQRTFDFFSAKAPFDHFLRLTRLVNNRGFNAEFQSRDEIFDLYGALELEPDADTRSIKRAFRKLSVKYHPDKNPGAEARGKFALVREAYEVLTDADKRVVYDMGGKEALDKLQKDGDMPPQNSELGRTLSLTLEQMYTGVVLSVIIPRNVVCIGCRFKRRGKCSECKRCADEIVTYFERRGPYMQRKRKRVRSKYKCKHEQSQIEVDISKGTSKWDKFFFARKGDQSPGHLPGDVRLHINQQKHDVYTRRGDDLYMKLELTLKQALIGFKTTIHHMDGHTVVATVDPGMDTGDMIKIEGEGMPIKDFPSTFGNLYITVKVVLPKNLSAEQQQVIGKYFE